MLLFPALLTALILGVFYYDMTRYIIPNWLCGVVLALYPLFLLCAHFFGAGFPENFNALYSFAAFAGVFALGMLVFSLRWMGGGDVKLLAVLALWTGKETTLEFLLYMGVLGGLLALGLVMIRPLVGRFYAKGDANKLPRLFQYHAPVPYGLAIGTSFLILLWGDKIPGLSV